MMFSSKSAVNIGLMIATLASSLTLLCFIGVDLANGLIEIFQVNQNLETLIVIFSVDMRRH